MSEVANGNGKPKRRVLLVEDEGKVIVQINRNGPEIEIDVVRVSNAWLLIQQGYRDQEGKMSPEQIEASNEALMLFIRNLFMEAAGEDPEKQKIMAEEGQKLSLTGALTFLRVITQEVDRLKDFFEVKSATAPSSRGSTELTFST